MRQQPLGEQVGLHDLIIMKKGKGGGGGALGGGLYAVEASL